MAPKWLAGYMPTAKVLCRRGLSESDACPCCGQPEDTEHILICKSTDATGRWSANMHSLTRWFRLHHTMPAISRLILYQLQAWRSSSPTAPFRNTDPLLTDAATDQACIGWQGLLEGFASVHWQQAQAAHFARIGSRLSGRRWLIALLRKGWNISWDMWDHRCSVRSSPSSLFLQEAHITLNESIQHEYTTGTDGWRASDMRWFRRTVPSLAAESVEYKRQWLSHVTLIRSRNLRCRPTIEDRQRSSFRRFFR